MNHFTWNLFIKALKVLNPILSTVSIGTYISIIQGGTELTHKDGGLKLVSKVRN